MWHIGGQLKILSKDQLDQIHLGVLEVLREVGITVNEENARRILKDAGAYVDERTKNVRIPAHLVEEAIRKTPRRFTVHARNPNYSVRMGDRKVWFEPMIGRNFILDLSTGKKRPTNAEDAKNLMKLVDALDHYYIPHSPAMMPHIEGIPDHAAHAYGLYAAITNTSKVVKGNPRGAQNAKDCLRMAAVLAGGEEELRKKPMVYTTSNQISPLQLDHEQTAGLIEYAKLGQPVDCAAEPQSGSTSPVTLAGTIVQMEAEVLSAVTVAQLVNPGTPLWIGTVGASMDMRRGMIALGGIEAAMLNVAHAQMAQYWGIPSRGTGATTESKTLDMQAGMEKTITLMMAAFAGINMIFYPGTIEYAKTISFESLIVDSELCGIIYRALDGITVDEDHLALDLIKEVGSTGHYLGKKHTVDWLQREHYIPKYFNRELRDAWLEHGEKDIAQIANEEAKRILQEHEPEPLDKTVHQEIEAILNEVMKRK
ncbi:MAG: trimethylamine methyltransferase family protein [Candidatus Ranarchaeia archaeon]